MNFEVLLEQLDEEKYGVLQRAVELGKWPDGRVLNEEEKATSLRLLIAYDAKHKPEEERIGYIPPKNKKDEVSQPEDEQLIHRSK